MFWMNVFVLPCLSSVIIKRLNLSFHLKNRKVNGCSKGKALHHSFSHLKETGIKKFLTIRNPLADLRKEKVGKTRTAICRPVWSFEMIEGINSLPCPLLELPQGSYGLIWAFHLISFRWIFSFSYEIASETFEAISCFRTMSVYCLNMV